MVCLGNICRSPIAEGVMQHKANAAGLDWIIDSAGTNSYHTGEAPHRHSQAICKANGIDISDQRARKFVASDFESYDKIYAMAGDVYLEINRIGGGHADMRKVDYFLNELEPGANASVPDPWYGNEDGYEPVYDMINATCEKILSKYGNK
ncbi:MAG: low molecular weight phosphotyrosine protein phosphatase [Taibaiella sp.]|nr:low molecular weight phosphotyrosine protein phosphatase [Taibaiella sp.]